MTETKRSSAMGGLSVAIAHLAAVASVLATPPGLRADAPFVLEVRAGDADRRETPIRWELPAGTDASGDWFLVREGGADPQGREDPKGRKEVPVQVDRIGRPAAVWILEEPLLAGGTRRYVLERGRSWAFADRVTLADAGGKTVLVRVAGKDVLAYNHGTIAPLEGIEPLYERSGYIHPVWSPSGLVVTNDSPANHKHHHGIWTAWSQTVFEGRATNFWEQVRQEGKVECVGLEARVQGPVFAALRARHRFSDLRAPGGPRPVLDETWEITVYALDAYHIVDLVAVQRCSGASPLSIKRHLYGGLGFRGSGGWEGKDGVRFLTSEGRTRGDGHATTASWCELSGKVGGKPAGIALLCHPSTFRAPQGMRIHPDEPFFSFTPCQAGDFELEPGQDLLLRYRIAIRDEAAGAAELDRLWKDFVDPPRVARVAP